MLNALNEYLTNKIANLTDICRKYKINKNDFINYLHNNGYYAAGNGKKKQSIISLHDASIEYLNSTKKVTFGEIAKKYKINSTSFKEYYNIYYGEKCWRFNNTVFDSIDTEEKAYWLGFIFADGCIGNSPLNDNLKYKKYTFEIGLQISDITHLEKLQKFLEFNGKIERSKNVCRLRINNKHFWEILNSYGCTPRKSLTLQFPNENIFKDKSLIKHFIRGYWDGDGCLTFKRANYPNTSVIGTEQFILKLQNYLGILGNIYQNSESNNITKKLMYNGLKAFQVSKYLYDNCNIYLNRKYDKYLLYCRIFEKSNILLQTNIGEGCDANPEITENSKEFSAS